MTFSIEDLEIINTAEDVVVTDLVQVGSTVKAEFVCCTCGKTWSQEVNPDFEGEISCECSNVIDLFPPSKHNSPILRGSYFDFYVVGVSDTTKGHLLAKLKFWEEHLEVPLQYNRVEGAASEPGSSKMYQLELELLAYLQDNFEFSMGDYLVSAAENRKDLENKGKETQELLEKTRSLTGDLSRAIRSMQKAGTDSDLIKDRLKLLNSFLEGVREEVKEEVKK